MYKSPYGAPAIFPAGDWFVARSNAVSVPSPSWRSQGLHDLRLGHSIPQTTPARLKACEPAQQKGQRATDDDPCDNSSLELRNAHAPIFANDERSHAGPVAQDEGESHLPALADAIG